MAANPENQAQALALARALNRVETSLVFHQKSLERATKGAERLKTALDELHNLAGEGLAQFCDTLGLDPEIILNAAGGPKPV